MSLNTEDGRLIVVSGKSRSGKTALMAKRYGKEKRAIAWDIEEQWCKLPGWRRVTSRAELLALCQQPGPLRIAYVSHAKDIKPDFDFWAGCALYWGKYFGGCVAIAEELADVTTSSKAPGNWGILLRRGLKRSVSIIAISQRWAEADKTALGNVSEFVCFKAKGKDVAYMAERSGIPLADLEALQPEYWDEAETKLKRGPYISITGTGKMTRGEVRFPAPKG